MISFRALFICLITLFLIGCSNQDELPDYEKIVAEIGNFETITFGELNAHHSGLFFERRYPNADLKAYPVALDELILNRMQIIDLFENEEVPTEVILNDLQRVINDELFAAYFEHYFEEKYYTEDRKDFVLQNLSTEGLSEREIDRRVKKRIRDQNLDRALEDFDSLKVSKVIESEIEWNIEALSKLATIFNTGKNVTELNVSGYVMKYEGKDYEKEDIVFLYNNFLIPEETPDATISYVKSYLTEAVRLSKMAEEARELGLYGDLVTRNTPSQILRNRFRSQYLNYFVFDRIPELNEENLREFYERHKEDYLYQYAKRIVHVAEFNSQTAAEEAYQAVKKGINDFEEISNNRWKVKSFIRNAKGEIESFNSNELPILGEFAFELSKKGDISEPIQTSIDGKTKTVILRASTVLDEKVPEYSEIERLDFKMKEFYKDSLLTDLENKLKEKYQVTIYSDLLTELVKKRSN